MRAYLLNINLKVFLSCFFVGFFHFCAVAQYDKIVAADGSGDYTTIQAAILAAPATPTIPYKIFIKNGLYKEKVTINRTFVTLVGESVANVIIRWDDYYLKVPNLQPKSTATVTINANDVVMMNITVENRSANTADGPQALALNVNRDRCAFKNCRFIGGQDTIATDRNGTRQYFKDCYIDGNTDFIYGGSTALFDNCILYPRDRIDGGSGGYITAANTPINQAFGYVFRNCFIPQNNGTTSYTLGRPWGNDGSTADADKAHNQTIFINTVMGQSIKPEGWSVWNSGTNTSFINYGEYNSLKTDGSPVDVSGRVAWSKQLTAVEASAVTTASVFTNSSGTWNPCSISADFCNATTPELALSNFRIKKATNTSKISCNLNFPIGQINAALYRSNDSLVFTKVAEADLSLANFNFNFTDNLPATGAVYYYRMVAAKSGFSTFFSETIKVEGPLATLPLNLISFTATQQTGPTAGVRLLWKVADEKNTQVTIIEKSTNGLDFTAIATSRTNNVLGVNTYSWVDNSVNGVRVFYRLKLMDLNGSYSNSRVVEVSLKGGASLMVYPNPVTRGLITVTHPKAGVNAHLSVSTIPGKRVLTFEVAAGTVSSVLDFTGFNKGFYLLSYLNNNIKSVLSIVVL